MAKRVRIFLDDFLKKYLTAKNQPFLHNPKEIVGGKIHYDFH